VRGPLHVGKLDRQGRLNAVVPGSLVHIVDQLSNRHFLVDTGASYSIFPHTSAAAPSGPRMRGAASQLIPCWVKRLLVCLSKEDDFLGLFISSCFFSHHWCRFFTSFQTNGGSAANALVDKCSCESFATVSTLTVAAAADSGPPPAAQPAALISHRPPQSPASSVTGLLSHWPLPSADPVRRPPRR
jgi:hypothetical protein